MSNLPAYLHDIQQRDRGLRPRASASTSSTTIFEILDYNQHATRSPPTAASRSATRTGASAWSTSSLTKSYEYGLSKIYEMVINNNPAYAYLLEGNSLVDQKLVMAHVYGHVDFFKNNFFFSQDQPQDDRRAWRTTPPACAATSTGSASRRSRDFIDACLSLENLIDPMSPFIRAQPGPEARPRTRRRPTSAWRASRLRPRSTWTGSSTRPSSWTRSGKQAGARAATSPRSSPSEPERDVLLFLLEHAPLEPWERDILAIVRDEAYYFAPAAPDQDHERGLGHLLALARS